MENVNALYFYNNNDGFKNLPSAQHYSPHFIYIDSLNPPQISSKNILHNTGNIANTITGNGI